jgi:hypothetical protein
VHARTCVRASRDLASRETRERLDFRVTCQLEQRAPPASRGGQPSNVAASSRCIAVDCHSAQSHSNLWPRIRNPRCAFANRSLEFHHRDSSSAGSARARKLRARSSLLCRSVTNSTATQAARERETSGRSRLSRKFHSSRLEPGCCNDNSLAHPSWRDRQRSRSR